MPESKEWTTVRVPQDALDEARDAKGEDERWGDYLRRCVDKNPNPKAVIELGELSTVESESDFSVVLDRLSMLQASVDGKVDVVVQR